MVSFPEAFLHFRGRQLLYMVKPCTAADVRENAKMLQESWPPATAILREYIPVWTTYVPNCLFLYTSIVCWAIKAVQAILKAVWAFEGSYSRKYCMDVCLCTYMFRPCIYRVHTLYRHVHTMYMGTTYFMHVPLSYTIPLQTRLCHLH